MRVSIEAFGFLYVGMDPSLLVWRASRLKWRSSRTSKGSRAREVKGRHDSKVDNNKKLFLPLIIMQGKSLAKGILNALLEFQVCYIMARRWFHMFNVPGGVSAVPG